MLTLPVAAEAAKEYHEAFWFTLASVAALFIIALLISVTAGVRLEPSAPFGYVANVPSDPKYRDEATLGRVLAFGSTATYMVQAIVLFVSLRSLAYKRDDVPATAMIWLEAASVVLLPTWAFIAYLLGRITDTKDQD